MESEEKVELIKKAITQLMTEDDEINGNTLSTPDDEDNGNTATRRRHRQLLDKLLSELECLEQDKEDEIMKEVKEVKRQNTITHHLLTAMIVITVAWQLSEVSLILGIKHRISNPFKSVGDMFKGFFLKGGGGGAGRSSQDMEDMMKAASDAQKHFIQPSCLKIPELPSLDLPGFDTTGTDEGDDDDDYGHASNSESVF